MRSRTRPAKRLFGRDEWRPFFAWKPKKVWLGPTRKNYERPYLWVWLETIERKARDDDGVFPWVYRVQPPEPSADETPCSSTDSNQSGDEE